ncbi:hypothetical protein OIU78_016627 [Salix suchowensis]|nr:hypothetical protein OIU78_016627 [Salix suchowensis]
MLGSCSKIPVGIYSKETGRVSGTMLHYVEAEPKVPNCKVPCRVAPRRLELRCMASALNLKLWNKQGVISHNSPPEDEQGNSASFRGKL